MELTNKQKQGLKIAIDRYNQHEPYTIISGYAGSGKTTLVRYIIGALNIDPDRVAYAAYTGKAAQVMESRGCAGAQTTHQLLFNAKQTAKGYKFYKKQTEKIREEYDLIVIDEVSMLPLDFWTLLLSHKIHVIAMGDPAQLPPVQEDQNNHILDHPDIFLDEIMRQEQENEIIRLSMFVREGGKLENYQSEQKQVLLLPKEELNSGITDWADQILVGKNATRQQINAEIRANKGYLEKPQIGESVICLHNYWRYVTINKDEAPLTNGTIGTILNCITKTYNLPNYISRQPLNLYIMNIKTDNGDYMYLPVDQNSFHNLPPQLNEKQEYLLNKDSYTTAPIPLQFDYGYAITVHKSQGSEWDKVLVIEENFGQDYSKWLYTAITRAKEKLIIIKK